MFRFKSILYCSYNSVCHFPRFDLNNTTCFNCYSSFTLFRLHNNNCSVDFYNTAHQTTIILFTCNVSSYKTDWMFSLSVAFSVLHFISQVSSLMSAQVVCSIVAVYLFIRFSFTALCCCLFTSFSHFYTDVDAIFLFIHWLCKQAHYFCFWSFGLLF